MEPQTSAGGAGSRDIVPRVSENALFYGDNLDVLRRHVKDESVDLIYLDPPFNSNADYNVLFGHADGSRAAAQIKAFGDTWRWDQAASASYQEMVRRAVRSPRRCSRFARCWASPTCSRISR